MRYINQITAHLKYIYLVSLLNWIERVREKKRESERKSRPKLEIN